MRPQVRWPAFCSACLAPIDLDEVARARRERKMLTCPCGRTLVVLSAGTMRRLETSP